MPPNVIICSFLLYITFNIRSQSDFTFNKIILKHTVFIVLLNHFIYQIEIKKQKHIFK